MRPPVSVHLLRRPGRPQPGTVQQARLGVSIMRFSSHISESSTTFIGYFGWKRRVGRLPVPEAGKCLASLTAPDSLKTDGRCIVADRVRTFRPAQGWTGYS